MSAHWLDISKLNSWYISDFSELYCNQNSIPLHLFTCPGNYYSIYLVRCMYMKSLLDTFIIPRRTHSPAVSVHRSFGVRSCIINKYVTISGAECPRYHHRHRHWCGVDIMMSSSTQWIAGGWNRIVLLDIVVVLNLAFVGEWVVRNKFTHPWPTSDIWLLAYESVITESDLSRIHLCTSTYFASSASTAVLILDYT